MARTPEILQKGLALHNSGDLQQAELEYQKVLRIDPRHADALHLLGVLGQQRGEPALAVEYIGKAISVNGTNAVYHTNLSAAHLSLKRYRDAEQCCRRAVRLQPRYAEAYFNLGLALESQGNFDEAVAAYRQAIALKPTIAEAHLNLGNVLRSQGELTEAEACFLKAIEVRPCYAEAHYNLGNLLHARHENEAAIDAYRRALQFNPNYYDARFNLATVLQVCRRHDEAIEGFHEALRVNPTKAEAAYKLGTVLLDIGRLEEAVAAFRQALAVRPDDEAACDNLGQALLQLGKTDEAEECFRKAIEIRPDCVSAWNNLAAVFHSRGETSSAITCFRKALEFEPKHATANGNLGSILKNIGELAEAAACFDRVLECDPGNRRVRIQAATMLPPIYHSAEDLATCRQEFETKLTSLISEGVRLDPEKETLDNVFYLPYQGQNDRDLQSDLARLYPVPSSPPPIAVSYSYRAGLHDRRPDRPGVTGKIRIGFISHHFRSHTIGHLIQGIIAELSRERFSVTVLSIGDYHDPIAEAIRASADEFVVLPTYVPRARQMIADRRLDLLFYSDIGMDPYSYSLAFHRLATVQCVTWGHPVTTGAPNIDYFLSSELLEPDDADGHYTEHLVRLRGLPTYYHHPERPAQTRDRTHYGLPADCI